MTRLGWLALATVLVIIALLIGGWLLLTRYHAPAAAAPVEAATSTPDLSARSIYTNGVYGLSLIYPENDQVAEAFIPWRAGAIATGTPIVSLTDPDGIVRIGASDASKEVKACLKVGPGESALQDMQLGSTTFKAFVRDNQGTDNQLRITSYRAVHDAACIALESIQPLNNGAVASSTRIESILQGFTFARS